MTTKAHKEPTITFRILDYLERVDDFRTTAQIRKDLSLNHNQTCNTLNYLRSVHAINCVEQPDSLWWFATRTDDLRIRHHDERKPETHPRRKFRRKRKDPDHE